jgi:rhomboid protease GluP
MHRPLWTFIFLGANVLVWLAMTIMGGSQDPGVLVFFGAKYNPLIVAGQYWRLLTACFVHIGIVHLLFNSYALFSFGLEVERRFGRSRFLALYILSGLAGSVLSFIGSTKLSAGASGAIFGLVGAMIAYFATYRDEFGQWGKRQLRSVLLVAGYNLIWGFITPGIDYLGHIGGLLGGLALGWAYCPRYEVTHATLPVGSYEAVDRLPRTRVWAVSLGMAALLAALTYLGVRIQG